ncbi:MAG: hypothetical protein DWQ01_05460 [Planctomycetota bacterium]|nr:MAG: hypothetical protein DWQ01_05460 [Planctomycetota bacterium]
MPSRSFRWLLWLLPWLLAASLAAQNPRTGVLAANASGSAYGPSLASDGDTAALLYRDDFDESIQVVLSDGRGLTWSAPVRVDDGTSPAVKQVHDTSVAMAGQNIYACWTEDRFSLGTRDLYFNRSTDAGISFQPLDLLIDKGSPPGFWDTPFFRMAVDPQDPNDANDDLVVILMHVDGGLPPAPDALYLNYSTNSGQTFLPSAVPVSSHNWQASFFQIDLAVANGIAYAVWLDNLNFGIVADDCWLSAYDPLAAVFKVQDLMVNAPTGGFWDADDEPCVDARGSTVAVLWMRDPVGGPWVHDLRSNVSLDGGITWMGEVPVGNYTPGLHDVSYPDVAIAADGNLLAAWQDNRSGAYEVYSATSTSSGAGWLNDVQLSSTSMGLSVKLLCPENQAAAMWNAGSLPPNFEEAALSPDAGLSWNSPVVVSTNNGDVDSWAMAYNRYYDNFLMAWLADDFNPPNNDVYAGGFRPQTLIPIGNFSVPGSTVSFQIAHWPQPDHGMSFGVVASASLGSYVLADGRDLGIVYDFYFQQALTMIPGQLSGTINSSGGGSTASFPVPTLPPTLYTTAVAFTSFTNLGAATDLVPIP